jgi:alkylhydroperoxidase family enzyme
VLAGAAPAAVSAKVHAALALLAKVTKDHAAVTADDVRAVLATGVSPTGVADALNVGYLFNVITRLADSLQFEIGPQAAFDLSAKRLLARGYK